MISFDLRVDQGWPTLRATEVARPGKTLPIRRASYILRCGAGWLSSDHPDERTAIMTGWFSFTCCEDSTILFTELLKFRHIKTRKSLARLDVAFVEDAISSGSQPGEDDVTISDACQREIRDASG